VSQPGHGGIAEALSLAETFAAGEPLVVMLGDNLVEQSLRGFVERFQASPTGARVLLKAVGDPRRFGVAKLAGDRLVGIEEKPRAPTSSYAVTGIYGYDAQVFDIIRTLTRSARGELEITDVNNAYITRSRMAYDILEGWWLDAGLPGTLALASTLVRAQRVRSAEAPEVVTA
jgi:glucose-1-phosphate thymidylyltransferase